MSLFIIFEVWIFSKTMCTQKIIVFIFATKSSTSLTINSPIGGSHVIIGRSRPRLIQDSIPGYIVIFSCVQHRCGFSQLILSYSNEDDMLQLLRMQYEVVSVSYCDQLWIKFGIVTVFRFINSVSDFTVISNRRF